MWDLRWVLLGLGAALVAGVYLWSRGFVRVPVFVQRLPRRIPRTEPSINGEATAAVEPAALVEVVPEDPATKRSPDRIVALRLIPREGELGAERAVEALRNAGLEHGRYAIFHQQQDTIKEAFSVASLTEPGSFDLNNLEGTTIAGLSLFVVLPGTGDPVARFDAMVETARALSVELAADLFDERGSSWSSQRERYLREEIIEYRHQFERR